MLSQQAYLSIVAATMAAKRAKRGCAVQLTGKTGTSHPVCTADVADDKLATVALPTTTAVQAVSPVLADVLLVSVLSERTSVTLMVFEGMFSIWQTDSLRIYSYDDRRAWSIWQVTSICSR